jgi:two-component system, chemotaxis family, response regulator Rcp1
MAAVEILLVEDNPADALLVDQCLRHGDVPYRLHVVEDGDAAMAFLRREGQFADAPRPHLILLDLNLPVKDGREVLREMKMDESFRRIPVVIHTSSPSPEDIGQCYALRANCYVLKGSDFAEFDRTVRTVQDFWCRIVRLPAH